MFESHCGAQCFEYSKQEFGKWEGNTPPLPHGSTGSPSRASRGTPSAHSAGCQRTSRPHEGTGKSTRQRARTNTHRTFPLWVRSYPSLPRVNEALQTRTVKYICAFFPLVTILHPQMRCAPSCRFQKCLVFVQTRDQNVALELGRGLSSSDRPEFMMPMK